MKYFLQFLLIICVIFAFLFISAGISYSQSAVQEASSAAFACFFGIIARMLQAELHQLRN
jgi:hypothetical protein